MNETRHLEREIEHAFVSKLHKLGCVTKKLSMATKYGKSSWPDQLVIVPGNHVPGGNPDYYFVELKREGAKPTKKQLHNHEILKHCRCTVYVLAGMEDAMNWVDTLQMAYDL